MVLQDEGMVLRDVHLNNIGWRVHTEIDGDTLADTLIIFDPGHTPTEDRDIRTEMLSNQARQLLQDRPSSLPTHDVVY